MSALARRIFDMFETWYEADAGYESTSGCTEDGRTYDEVGVDALNVDALATNLLGEGAGEGRDEGLRACVRAEHRGRNTAAREGRHVEDQATLPTNLVSYQRSSERTTYYTSRSYQGGSSW